MTIRLTWRRVAAGLTALVAAGMLFAWSGVFNVAASAGHWPVTAWFLHWSFQSSVRTHSLAVPRDPIDRTGLVSAAGMFHQACASCHGAPGLNPLPIMQRAAPNAPNLSINAPEYRDRELFWILKHGVKYSGMPAWTAQNRDDEVRRMVGFVRAMPGMTPATYQALVGTAYLPRDAVSRCIGCHGADGRGRGPDVPVLGGQKPAYLAGALHDYWSGTRTSAVMGNAAAQLDRRQMRALAATFAALPGLVERGAPVSGLGGTGRAAAIVTRGLPVAQLPACASCHAPGRMGPVLGGQKASYIAQRLRHWRAGKDTVDARKDQNPMPVIARRIPENMIEPLARYYARGASRRQAGSE